MKNELLSSVSIRSLSSPSHAVVSSDSLADDLAALEKAARAEGAVNSIGMPDSWANWKDTWQDLYTQYGLTHSDTDMASGDQIVKFDAENANASADMGDIGEIFVPTALKKGVTQPYKPSTWEQIPAWAKDQEGHWALAYTGAIAFIIDKKHVKIIPHSWEELLKSRYVLHIGHFGTQAQARNGVMAANFAMGGDENNMGPGTTYFSTLSRLGRLRAAEPTISNLEKGEVEVGVLWDFNALNYRDKIDKDRFDVLIPSDGSVMSGYTTLINKYAKHPNAAKLVREYIFSDAGQINLARGYARPIRTQYLTLPEEVKAKLLPDAQYKSVHPITDADALDNSFEQLQRQWQEDVINPKP